MPKTNTFDSKAEAARLRSLNPAEIQEYINIALEALAETVSRLGMTTDELRAARKALVQKELADIEAELEELDEA